MLIDLFKRKAKNDDLNSILNYHSFEELERFYTTADNNLKDCINYKTGEGKYNGHWNYDYELSLHVVHNFRCMAQVKQILKLHQRNGSLPEKYSSLLDKNENIEKIFALCNEFENEIPEYTDYMKYFYNIALTGECNYEKESLKFHIDPNRYGSKIDRIPVIIEFLQRDKEKNPNFLHANQDEMKSIDAHLKYIETPELKEKFGALASYIRKNHTNSEVLGKMQGVLGYFIENKDADPNVFEFIGISEEDRKK